MAQNEPQRKEMPPGPSPNSPSLLFKYKCRSDKFIRLANRIEKIDSVTRIESKLFCPNWNALVHTHIHTCLIALCPGLPRYQSGKTSLDFTDARDSEWQWHQLGHMQVCTSLQTDNHTRTPSLSFLQAFPAAQPTSSKHW